MNRCFLSFVGDSTRFACGLLFKRYKVRFASGFKEFFMKKIVMFIAVVGVVVAAGVWIYLSLQVPAELMGARLLPADTMIYSGAKSTLKTRAALSLADFASELEELGLSKEDSKALDAWLSTVRGGHVGLIGFSVVPFSLDAAVILEGSFDDGLMSVLPESVTSVFDPVSSYRQVPVHSMQIPVNEICEIELCITDPVQGVTLITLSRSALHSTVDRLLDGGHSLADQANFMEMTALPEIQNKDVVTYMNLSAYLDTVFGLVRMVPMPSVQQIPVVLREELRLDELGPMVSGQSLLNAGRTVSYCKLSESMPLYQQQRYTSTVSLDDVPAGVTQASELQFADVALAHQQLVDVIDRICTRVAPLLPMAKMPADPIAMLEEMIGFPLGEIDPLLSGRFGMWQVMNSNLPEGSARIYKIGITDEVAVNDFIRDVVLESSGLQPLESEGVFSVVFGEAQVGWSVQPEYLLLCKDVPTLQAVLSPDALLKDFSEYKAMRKKLPENLSGLQYADYSHMAEMIKDLPLKSQPALVAVLDLFDGARVIQGSVAQEGMVRTESFVEHQITGEKLRELIRTIMDMAAE
jgi:hypothetical protein